MIYIVFYSVFTSFACACLYLGLTDAGLSSRAANRLSMALCGLSYMLLQLALMFIEHIGYKVCQDCFTQ